MERIIAEYTREAGVRELERQIARIMRKAAARWSQGQRPLRVRAEDLEELLDYPPYPEAKHEIELPPGVFYGLAWTETGGEVLRIETLAWGGKGELVTTGHLGEVIKESIRAALSYLKAHPRSWRVDPAGADIHLHIPEGAVPKDGPSAGLAALASMLSALTGRAAPGDVAATGEITLTGKVLPVGGLPEKLLAAKRAGIKKVFLPEANRGELESLDRRAGGRLTRGLSLSFVSTVEEFLRELGF